MVQINIMVSFELKESEERETCFTDLVLLLFLDWNKWVKKAEAEKRSRCDGVINCADSYNGA